MRDWMSAGGREGGREWVSEQTQGAMQEAMLRPYNKSTVNAPKAMQSPC